MTTQDDFMFANWHPFIVVAMPIVVSTIIIAFAFGPNCASTGEQLLAADAPAPTQLKVDGSTEVLPMVVPELPSCKQWVHTRLEDCRAQKGEFIRCMWWVFGSDHPDDYGIEPHRWDGANGYGAALHSE